MNDTQLVRKIIERGLYEAKDTGLIESWYYNGRYNIVLKSGARYSVAPECIVAAANLPGFPHVCERCGQQLRTGKVCVVESKLYCHDCAIMKLRALDQQISPEEAREQIDLACQMPPEKQRDLCNKMWRSTPRPKEPFPVAEFQYSEKLFPVEKEGSGGNSCPPLPPRGTGKGARGIIVPVGPKRRRGKV